MGEREPTIAAMNAFIRDGAQTRCAREDFAKFLTGRGLAKQDVDAMQAQGLQRFEVYRSLVHNRLKHAIRDFLERTVARLPRPQLDGDFEEFMRVVGPRSPYLRDVPDEFVQWVAPRWQAHASVPNYLADLARHELLEFDVRNDPEGGEADTGLALQLDHGLRFEGAVRLMRYAYAVHTLPYELEDRTEPAQQRTDLLVYRDASFSVRYLELTAYATAVLDGLLNAKLTVEAALKAGAETLGEPLDDSKLASAAQLFSDLAERGVLLGAEP